MGGPRLALLSLAAAAAVATAAACGGTAFTSPGDASADAGADAADATTHPDGPQGDATHDADATTVDSTLPDAPGDVIAMETSAEGSVACLGTPTSCGPAGGPCTDCTSSSLGHLCAGTVCACNGPSDCPSNTACQPTAPRQCGSACINSVGGCNGGCCDPSMGCVASCAGGCCNKTPEPPPAPAFPFCVSGMNDVACGAGGTCIDCTMMPMTPHCLSGACVTCRTSADCPTSLQACDKTTHTCGISCINSVNGCNVGCCATAVDKCVGTCTGGCCDMNNGFPKCAGTTDTACGSSGGMCANCQTCVFGGGMLCVVSTTGNFCGCGDAGVGVCCPTFTTCNPNGTCS